MAQSHALRELMSNKAFGRVQPVQGLLGFVIVSVHANKDASCLSSRRKHQLRHCSKPNPRIAKLTLYNEIDLSSPFTCPPLALVLRRARLNHENLPLR